MSARRWGTLYGVGLGPGDPELVTLKALRVLQSVPTLLLPVRRAGDPSYALSIAEPHLTPGQQRIVYLPFPQERGEVELDEQWDRNTLEILNVLADGQDAAFLAEGDPLFYSTFGQILVRLRASTPDLRIEIVPGVSSMTAAASATGEPLVTRGDRLAVLPTVYGPAELRRTLQDFDTVVLLKVNRVLAEVKTTLTELGLNDRAVLIERYGRPEQRIVRGLDEELPDGADYFSLVIVRK
jgi:precorrin-2/cobalt-factor-2 C20-methyltransferase